MGKFGAVVTAEIALAPGIFDKMRNLVVEATNTGTARERMMAKIGEFPEETLLQVHGWRWSESGIKARITESTHSWGLRQSSFATYLSDNGTLQPFGDFPGDDYQLEVLYARVNGVRTPTAEELEEDEWDKKASEVMAEHPISRLLGLFDHGEPTMLLGVPSKNKFSGKGGLFVSFFENTPPFSLRAALEMVKTVPDEVLVWWNPHRVKPLPQWHFARDAEKLICVERDRKLTFMREEKERAEREKAKAAAESTVES